MLKDIKADSATSDGYVFETSLVQSSSILTKRETEVLELIAQGLSNKLIAVRLDISAHTAKFHIKNAAAKMGASTRTQAALNAVKLGLIDL